MSSTKFNANVHGARGLFAFALFVFHVAKSKLPLPDLAHYEYVQTALLALEFGVELFFIISGIVIYGAYQRSTSLTSFFLNRATRIWPLLWVTMSVMFVLTLLGTDKVAGEPWPVIAMYFVGNMLALPPMLQIPLFHPAAWSLSYEFAFYGLIVIFGLLGRRMPKDRAMAIVVLLGLALYWHHIRSIYFIAGLLIGAGLTDHQRFSRLARHPLAWMLVFLATWKTLAIIVGGNIHDAIFSRLAVEPYLIPLVLLAFFSALMAMTGISQGHGNFSKFLRMPVMQWLGTISFSFYLWQGPVLALVKKGMYVTHLVEKSGGLAQPIFFILALPPVLLVSHYSQIYLEDRITRKLRKWTSKDKPVLEPGSLQSPTT